MPFLVLACMYYSLGRSTPDYTDRNLGPSLALAPRTHTHTHTHTRARDLDPPQQFRYRVRMKDTCSVRGGGMPKESSRPAPHFTQYLSVF